MEGSKHIFCRIPGFFFNFHGSRLAGKSGREKLCFPKFPERISGYFEKFSGAGRPEKFPAFR